jgi:hypothetical protein
MKLTVRRFEASDLDAVTRFNARLRAAGDAHRVDPEGPETGRDGEPVTGRLFVALEGGELRGACWLHEQDVWIAGQQHRAGFLRLPLSESVVNPAYNGVPGSLIMQMTRVQPRLMALGLGAHDTAVARLLAAFKWTGATVPMCFALVRPNAVLRGLTYARQDVRRRRLMDVAAWSGAGWVAGALQGGMRALKLRAAPRYDAEAVPQYGTWTDELWARTRSEYGLVPARDSATLNFLYRPDYYAEFHRLRIRHRGTDVGTASVLRVDFSRRDPDPYFGRLRVGLVADVFGPLTQARGITAAALRYLLERDVDLLVSFQMHPTWYGWLTAFGFRPGPSNFCWYRNGGVEKLMAGGDAGVPHVHLNRADAEGPRWFGGERA